MASIILSFVGQQDPFGKESSEGSIVTLVNHLIQQEQPIKWVILLHTEATEPGAIDTQTWLTTTHNIPMQAIRLFAVDSALSQDPVNLLLAVQAARYGIEQALPCLGATDTLEFNASSGTPVMKSAWSILQAAGYAPQSHVWQVRNPHEMQPNQNRVFQTDVNTLKDEFDLKSIQQQVQNYNYRGAWIALQQSNLHTPKIAALLEYSYYRLSMDFDRAFSAIGSIPTLDSQWVQEIAPLRQKDGRSLLQEAYFNALIRLQTHQFADFLVGLFRLQEQILYYLVQERMGLNVSGKPNQKQQSWQVIRQVDQGKLYEFLQGYTLPRGGKIDFNRPISRYVLQAIVEYSAQFATIVPLIKDLNQYCELRNEAVHGFTGVSEIEDKEVLLKTLSKLMRQLVQLPAVSPFDRLNQQICSLLSQTL